MNNNWQTEKLGNLVNTIKAGGTPTSTVPEFYNGEIPFVSIEDITDTKKTLTQTKKYLSQKGLNNSAAWLIPKKFLIYSMYASVGKVRYLGINAATSQAIIAFDTNDKIDREYIYYFLEDFEQSVYKLTSQTTQANLSAAIVKKINISFPESIIQQRKIAQIFNSIDEVINRMEEAIKKYKDIKQGMMRDLFSTGIDINTGNLRPSHKDAPELYKKGALGWIPKEWEVKKLKEVVEVRVSNVDKKIHPNKKLVRLCNYMDAYRNDFITDNLEFTIGSANINEVNRFELLKNDVIITKDSETPDDIAIPSIVIENLNNVVCGYHLAILRPIKNRVTGMFLMYNLKIPNVQNYFFRIASGSTRYGLTIGGIENVRIAVPKEKEQNQISQRMMKIDDLITQEQKNLEKHQTIKKGLMQDLLTGKVEVTV